MQFSTIILKLVTLTLVLTIALGLLPGLTSAQTVPSENEIHVTVAVLDPHTVADVFGKRIARRFVALQVTIRNKSDEHQYLIQDVSLDLAKIFPAQYLVERDKTECAAKLEACRFWNQNLDQVAKDRDLRLEAAAGELDERLEDAAKERDQRLAEAARERDERLTEAARARDYRLAEAAKARDRHLAEAARLRDDLLAEAARQRDEGLGKAAKAKNKKLDEAVKLENIKQDEAVRVENITQDEAVRVKNMDLDEAVRVTNRNRDDAAQANNRKLDDAARTQNARLSDEIRTRNRRLDDAAQQQCSCTKADYRLSSLELSLLRGVAEKGQGQDPRNKVYRFLQAVGTVAGGLVGVAGFGPSYGGSVAIFNGPTLSAYSNAFPDYTINQMNRLSDSAYQSNTLVPRQQAKVLVAFVPQSMFLSKTQRDTFWKDPTNLFNDTNPTKQIDFRRAVARVSGSFIVELKNLPPSVVAVQIDDDELRKFQDDKPIVRGYLAGRFSPDVKISLLNLTPKGLSIKLDGTPQNNRLNFIIESTQPVTPDTFLNFEVANDQAVQTISRPIHYKVDAPTITDITPKEGYLNTPELDVEITGTNFIPGETKVLLDGTGVRVLGVVEVLSSTKLKTKLWLDKVEAVAPPGDRKVRVANPTGASIGFVTFKVKPAAAAAPTPTTPEP